MVCSAAGEMPEVFLGGSSGMNATRLAEVLGFALPQLVAGHAQRVLLSLSLGQVFSRQLRLRQAHLLQPLAGILLVLWRAEQLGPTPAQQQQQQQQQEQRVAASEGQAPPEEGQPAEGSRGWRHSIVDALSRQPALTDAVLQGLLAVKVGGLQCVPSFQMLIRRRCLLGPE